HPGWLRQVQQRSTFQAQWALSLVVPRMDVVREDDPVQWTTNELGLVPNVRTPTQLISGTGLRPVIGSERGMLVGQLVERNRTVLVLADPDVISNHGLAREGNAALAVALIKRLRGPNGTVVRSEEHTSELQSRFDLVCRLLLEKKKEGSRAPASRGARPRGTPKAD